MGQRGVIVLFYTHIVDLGLGTYGLESEYYIMTISFPFFSPFAFFFSVSSTDVTGTRTGITMDWVSLYAHRVTSLGKTAAFQRLTKLTGLTMVCT
ncbi:hypothetical protein VTG60DRAFT_1905 [Thermothelomyces hinnuleus]